MNYWDCYQSRMAAKGEDRRGSALRRGSRLMENRMRNSLSFHQVVINGEARGVSVINSDNLDIKTLLTLPGEDLPHGGYVEWADNHWIITERDANNEMYTRGVMRQCNYLLRWVSDDGNIIERWCIVEDGTKYLIGELADKDFVITKGDSRLTLTLPRDSQTVRLDRDNRFLIDDPQSPSVLAYRLTKPFKLGGSYGGHGIMKFVLQECGTEDTDHTGLRIANYYKYFPRDDKNVKRPAQDVGAETERKVWI